MLILYYSRGHILGSDARRPFSALTVVKSRVFIEFSRVGSTVLDILHWIHFAVYKIQDFLRTLIYYVLNLRGCPTLAYPLKLKESIWKSFRAENAPTFARPNYTPIPYIKYEINDLDRSLVSKTFFIIFSVKPSFNPSLAAIITSMPVCFKGVILRKVWRSKFLK